MTGELGIGLVGIGWMGRLHAEAYARLRYHFPAAPRPRFVIAADESATRAESGLALGFERVCGDWQAVVEHRAVDAVSIAVPNHMHRDIARAAAAAGKHVWIEKPVGRSAGETGEIAAAIARAGVMSMVGFDLRFIPVLEHARALVADGRLGRLTAVRAAFLSDFGCDPGLPPAWRFQRGRAGYGVLTDLMMHLVDLIAFVVSPIRHVCACAGTAARGPLDPGPAERGGVVENEDHVISLLCLDDDVQGCAEASRVAAGRRSEIRLEIDGLAGSLSWRFDRMNELRMHSGPDSSEPTVTTIVAGPGHGEFAAFQPAPGLPMGYDDLKVIEASAFATAIASGRACSPDVHEALRSARALEAMDRSWRAGRWEPVEQA